MAQFNNDKHSDEKSLKVFDISGIVLDELIRVLDETKGNVYLLSKEGDRINLKSKLSQITGLSGLLQGGKIVDGEIMCENPEDEAKIFNLNLFGEADIRDYDEKKDK